MVKDGSERENGRLSTMDSIESQLVFQDEDKSEIEDEEDNEDLTPRIGPRINSFDIKALEVSGAQRNNFEVIEDDPKYWGVISSPLAVGWLGIAVKMLRLHGSYQLDQLGNPEQNGFEDWWRR
ncbi:unnamed protein product [Camellia sinensis]